LSCPSVFPLGFIIHQFEIKMGEKRVTDKRFGVKNDIIEDLRRFQLLVSLKYQRKRMAFVGYVNVTVNRAPTRVRVEAKEKRISITPS
ncbi:unnamed protein product, partial [Tenebrio molitor]